MPSYSFRLAMQADRDAITAFVRTHWGQPHSLIEQAFFFDYYYDAGDGRLRFALAECEGQLAALAGYIPASGGPQPDIWVSLWLAGPAFQGSGLALMDALPGLTGCRVLACNNIRSETRPFYHFLGHTTGQLQHWYRLAPRKAYAIAVLRQPHIPPVAGSTVFTLVDSPEALLASGFVPPEDANPYKDMAYLIRRYFYYPRQQYALYTAALPGEAAPRGLLAVRSAPALGSAALRLVDWIGPPQLLAQAGPAIDELMREAGAEYADLYCAGLPEDALKQAGFTLRDEAGPDIIPTYLSPPLIQNVNYYYFTSRPEGFTIFKADGDQDRPNL